MTLTQMRGDDLMPYIPIDDVKIKAIYVGENNEAVKVWDKEEGVLNQELYESCLRQMHDALTELKTKLLVEEIVEEEKSLWQKLLKWLTPKKLKK